MTNEEKLKILPFLDNGRWYTLFVENDNGKYKITTGDDLLKDSEITGTSITFPENFIVIDIKCKCIGHSGTNGTMSEAQNGSSVTVVLPNDIDYCTLYIYGYML